MLEKEIVKLYKTIEDEKRLGDKRTEQLFDLITASGVLDKKVAVDVAATSDYIGAAFNDGVLRTAAPLTYADGGDFVTLGFSFLGFEALADPGADRIAFWDDSEGALKWLQLGGGVSIDATPRLNIDHDAIDNFSANKHIDHAAVSIIAGVGLSGGGTLVADRTLAIDINSIAEDAGVVSGDFFVYYDTVDGVHYKIDHDDMPCLWIRGPLPGLYFDSGGVVTIGTTTHDSKMTEGLCLFQGASDDIILALQSSDVLHGVIDFCDTNTYGFFKKVAGATGGLRVEGIGEASIGLELEGGVYADNPPSWSQTSAPVIVTGKKKSGTGYAEITSTDILFAVHNLNDPRLLVSGQGDLFVKNSIYIYDTTLNAHMTLGLTIQQGGADDEIFALKSSDVAHEWYNEQAEPDTFFDIAKYSPSLGGVLMRCMAEVTAVVGLELRAGGAVTNTVKSAAGIAPIMLVATGGGDGSYTTPGNDANLVVIRKKDTTTHIFDEDGDTWMAGGLTIGACTAAGIDTDKFLCLDAGGNIDYRTGALLMSDLSGEAAAGFSFNDQYITNVQQIRGCPDHHLNIYANATVIDAVEKDIIFNVLNEAGDVWLEVFRCEANGVAPTLKLAKALNANAQNFTGVGTIGCGDITAEHLALGGMVINDDYVLYLDEVLIDTDNSSKVGVYSQIQVAKTAAVMTNSARGFMGGVVLNSTNTQNWTNILGLRGVHGRIITEAGSSGTVTGAAVFASYANIADAALLTDLYGFLINTPTVAGNKVINEYGLYIKDQNTGDVLNFAIYTNAGLLRFGDSIFCTGLKSGADQAAAGAAANELYHDTDDNTIKIGV